MNPFIFYPQLRHPELVEGSVQPPANYFTWVVLLEGRAPARPRTTGRSSLQGCGYLILIP